MKKYGQTGTDERFEKVMEYADGILQKSYVCCFSKERDSLSQWRGYAADGTGLSLGIDASSIYNESTFSIKPLKVVPIVVQSVEKNLSISGA